MGYQIPDPKSAIIMKDKADKYHIDMDREHIENIYSKVLDAANHGAYGVEAEMYPAEVLAFKKLGYRVHRKLFTLNMYRIWWN